MRKLEIHGTLGHSGYSFKNDEDNEFDITPEECKQGILIGKQISLYFEKLKLKIENAPLAQLDRATDF